MSAFPDSGRSINQDIDSKAPTNVADNLEGSDVFQVRWNHYINTICHEISHGLGLRKLWLSETGGNHWTVEDRVWESQFIDHRSKGRTTTFYFGDKFFPPADMEDFVVWEPQF